MAADTILFTLVVPALPVFAERYDLLNSEVALIFAAFPLPVLARGAQGAVAGLAWTAGMAALLIAGLATFAYRVLDPERETAT